MLSAAFISLESWAAPFKVFVPRRELEDILQMVTLMGDLKVK
jgi:hypothetical protein